MSMKEQRSAVLSGSVGPGGPGGLLGSHQKYWVAAVSCSKTRSAQVVLVFPRQTGMGLVSIFSRIGGILTPLILLLSDYYAALPMLLFGIIPIVVGVLGILLPETRGQSLKDTIQDLDQQQPPGQKGCLF